ncbi:conserved hypothetical protein [Methanococcus vannielii SB]|jgi:hypothetical protein|uniref:DUF2193 domain-containing protein n=1 Tax=Methanococcus vannielii (strain ATCC 35089 / DSM 1224 / JCM 13029 / OCM 148 / SB) TaxID=406327 RepID=A6UNI8_METVS|nr:DUF2193 domain-containing protein [Methanococcus vannielii]ABR54060.1 conserved hypothetical protein [Methanococcus vannielii SB]
MEELFSKMVDEAMAAQWADVNIIKEKRGKDFKIKHAKSYVDVANKMEPVSGQCPAVFSLHKDSINAHFDILCDLTKTVRPEDDPFVEHYQTPAILEILYKEDPEFRKSVEKFIDAVDKSESLIGREVIRRYAGFYGPTCVVDFALIPGSTSNIVNQILKDVDIPKNHKQAILAAKSWGMNTSYGFGEKFANAIELGKSVNEAIKEELEMIKLVYDRPIDAQAKLMDDFGHKSFDVRKYMSEYKRRMEKSVKEALEQEVHYGNIVTVPAYCVGDISHHVAQSTFNMCKDDVIMSVIEAVSEVMDTTLRENVKNFKNEYQVLSVATGSTAAATECILELDGFNAPTVVDLLTKRFHNFVQLNPTRSAAAELHNHDFMDMIYRGWKLIDKARRVKNGSGDKLKPKVGEFSVNLDPIFNNEVLMNPQRYAYPGCAITVRFSALMRLSDYPCLLTSEPVTATLMTNIIALHKETPGAPARVCKDCATACLADFRHQYCQYKEAV